MTGKYKPKSRNKIVETSLGKAPKDTEQGPDLSHLRTPITTSVSTLKHIFALFQTATPEVQDYITYECDILYECRFCRTLYRSLANFILHKRNYCRNKWKYGGQNNQGGFVIGDDVKTSDEDSRCTTPLDCDLNIKNDFENNNKKKNIVPIIDKLLKRQKGQILAKSLLNEDLSKNDNSDDDVMFVSEENNVILEKIDCSGAAVFQTKLDASEKKDEFMKSEILEIHDMLDKNCATLDPGGKVAPKLSNSLICTECNLTFLTEKTLTHHIRYKHNKTCIVFPCPDCKETFSNAWSVYRHLYKVHRRTPKQVRRMRYLVHSSGIRKDEEPEKKKQKLNVVDEENEENQWMNNFEGDKDIQMCGGCGKRFERKAALHSHSQMCTKRIAICNSLKNVKVSKNEKKEQVNKETKIKGAAKRKQKPQTRCLKEEIIEIKVVAEEETIPNVTKETIPDVTKNQQEETTNVTKETIPDVTTVEEEETTNVTKETIPDVTTVQEEEEIPNVTKETIPDVTTVEEEEEIPNVTKIAEEETSNVMVGGPVLSENSDVTITKDSDSSSAPATPPLPEIEIFTISDDSNESDVSEKRIPDEYKEYLTDDEDHSFVFQMMRFIDKKQLKCIPCDTNFLSHYMLLHHMALHFSWFRFQCSKCSFVSFHRHDCKTHAYSRHSVTNNMIDSTVLPIPKWKVLSTSHEFIDLDEERVAVMPLLEAEKLQNHEMAETETIILEDDEMPDITENGFTDPLTFLDEDTKKKIIEKKEMKAGPSVVNSRPIRNRTRSVKTVQNDFIYDLGKVFKVDNPPKKKIKKGFSKV